MEVGDGLTIAFAGPVTGWELRDWQHKGGWEPDNASTPQARARVTISMEDFFFFWKQMAIAIQDRGTSLAPCLVVLVELINPYRYSST